MNMLDLGGSVPLESGSHIKKVESAGDAIEEYDISWTAIVLRDGKVSSFRFKSDTRADDAYRVIKKVSAPDGYTVLGVLRGNHVKDFWGINLEKQKIIYHKS
jgi:hypothetical protein